MQLLNNVLRYALHITLHMMVAILVKFVQQVVLAVMERRKLNVPVVNQDSIYIKINVCSVV